MATQVTRNLDEIEARVKQLGTSLKAAQKESRTLDSALRVNPSNVEAARAKTKNLAQQVSLAAQQLRLLQTQQAGYDRAAQQGLPVDQRKYKALTDQIQRARIELSTLQTQQKRLTTDRLNAMSTSLRSVARYAATALAALGGLIVAAAKLGGEIQDNANKIGVSYKTYQVMANQFQLLTGSSEDYVSAMSAVNTMMGQIAKGNTSKAEKALSAVGLTLEDIKGMGSEEIFSVIMERLAAIPDEAERSAAAIAVFGNAGSAVAIVAGTAADELERMDDEFVRNSLLSDETVDKAGQMDDRMDQLKARFKTVAVEIGTALAPALESIARIAEKIAPIIEGVANAFSNMGAGGQIAVIGSLALLAALPGLISGIVALKTSLDALASNPVMAAVAGVVALGAIAGGAALLTAGLSNAATNAAYNYSTTNNSANNDYSTTVINVSGADVDADEIAYQIAEAKKARGY